MSIFREQLTPLLAPAYLAKLETQIVIDHPDDDFQVVLPDVSVTSPDVSTAAPSAAAVAAPAPVQVRVPLDLPTRLVSVDIRQRESARLVTAGALDFIERVPKAGKPIFLWWNSTRMHICTHLKPESQGRTGLGNYLGEHVTMSVELLTVTTFASAPVFEFPKIPEAILMQLEERPVLGTEEIDGESYTVQRHELVLFVMRQCPAPLVGCSPSRP